MKALFIQSDPFSNLGLMYISSSIQARGHKTDLLVSNSTPDLIAEVKKISPDLIAIPCTTGMHTWAMNLAADLKKHMDVKIILGGSHPTYYPDCVNHPAVDMICVGDGEEAFAELMDDLNRVDIPSLHIKKDGMIYKNPVRNLKQELDDLPFPDRDLYHRYPFVVNQDNLRIITMRGCPYRCSFCFHESLRGIMEGKGKYVRRRSVENVILEIKECVAKYKYKRIDFQDETFTINVNTWLKEFLVVYKKEVNLPFTATVRPNGIDDELIRLLAEAGCHTLKMGFETADQKLNNEVLKKDVTIEGLENAVRLFQKYGIKIQTFNLIGIPGESIDNAINTMKWNAKWKIDFARVSFVQPFPMTGIEDYAKEHGYLDKNWNLDDFEGSHFIASPLKLENRDQFINLQKLWGLGVRYPSFIPMIRKLIKVKPNKLYELIFKIDFALSIRKVDRVSVKDFFNFGLRSKGFFSKKKEVTKTAAA
jgi:anaerobic magnesium-protoporphyrin IX monomethyl ester cyclase